MTLLKYRQNKRGMRSWDQATRRQRYEVDLMPSRQNLDKLAKALSANDPPSLGIWTSHPWSGELVLRSTCTTSEPIRLPILKSTRRWPLRCAKTTKTRMRVGHSVSGK